MYLPLLLLLQLVLLLLLLFVWLSLLIYIVIVEIYRRLLGVGAATGRSCNSHREIRSINRSNIWIRDCNFDESIIVRLYYSISISIAEISITRANVYIYIEKRSSKIIFLIVLDRIYDVYWHRSSLSILGVQCKLSIPNFPE